VIATNSSLNPLGETAFAEPPELVVAVKNSCFSIFPVDESENAEM
jgi:hypothetical protein